MTTSEPELNFGQRNSRPSLLNKNRQSSSETSHEPSLDNVTGEGNNKDVKELVNAKSVALVEDVWPVMLL